MLATDAGHFKISRRVVRFSRLEIDRHLSSGLSAAQSAREERSLEGFAEGDGGPRTAAEETLGAPVALFSRHHSRTDGRALLGRSGFRGALCVAARGRVSHAFLHAVLRLPRSQRLSEIPRRIFRRHRSRLAPLGAGRARRGAEHGCLALALLLVRNWSDEHRRACVVRAIRRSRSRSRS